MADDYTTSATGTVSVDGSVTGVIDFYGDTDPFMATLVAGRRYTIDLEGSPTRQGTLNDSYLRVFNSAGTLIASDDDGGVGFNSRLSSLTVSTTGSYMLSAAAYSGLGSYRLTLRQEAPPDAAGNTLSSARALTWLAGSEQSYSDYVGSTDDTNDFYRFTTSVATDLRVTLAGLTGDANVLLLDQSGTAVSGTTGGLESGTAGETLIRNTLAAGTYYLSVVPASGAQSDYTLAWSAANAAPTDAVGGDIAGARDLGTVGATTTTAEESVGGTDSADVYRFTTSGPTNLSLALTGLTGNADLQLLDQSGTVVASSLNSGSDGESISRASLAAGTYYANVFPRAGAGVTTYTLSVTAPSSIPADSAGDSLDLARDAGAVGLTARGFDDYIGGSDLNDYYRFTTTGTTNFAASLRGLSANANVRLLDTGGTEVANTTGGTNTGTADEALSRERLTAGTYYLHVLPATDRDASSYSVSLSATPVNNPDRVGDTVAAAQSLGTLSASNRTLEGGGQETVEDSDVDVYSFRLTQAAAIRFQLSNLAAAANIEVLEANGSGGSEVLRRSPDNGTGNDDLSWRFDAAGTYYVRVGAGGATPTAYSLGLSLLQDGAGNTLPRADNLGSLRLSNQPTRQSDFIGDVDEIDYYKFTLGARATLNVGLTGMAASAAVTLLTATERTIVSTDTDGSNTEALNRPLGAGTYYLRVGQRNGANTAYTLALGATAVDAAGGDAAGARDLGQIGATASRTTDWVGGDDVDVYRFTVVAPTAVTAQLSDMAADADLTLRDASGQTIRRSNSSGTANDNITQSLAAGTYLLEVRPDRSVETPYRINLSGVITDAAGNTVAAARNVGAIVPSRSTLFNGADYVGTGDSHDFYRFTVHAATAFTATLSGLAGDADMTLLSGANGAQVEATSTRDGIADQTVAQTLQAGTYYLRISDRGLDTPYTVTMAGQVVDQAGNSRDESKDLGQLVAGASTFNDFVGGSDVDFYSFQVGSATDVQIQLSNLAADADLTLMNAGGRAIRTTNTSGTTPDALEVSLTRGTYYLRVAADRGQNTGYRVRVAGTPDDSAGNTLQTARDLGTIPTTRALRAYDFVGRDDRIDLYKVTLRARATLTADISDLAADTNVTYALLRTNGQTIVSTDTREGTDQIQQTLAAGSYYLRITPIGSSNTSYTLAASLTAAEAQPAAILPAETRVAGRRAAAVGARLQLDDPTPLSAGSATTAGGTMRGGERTGIGLLGLAGVA